MQAVVLGGSIAGLMAARVLSEHVDQVTIIDPDDLLDSSGDRSGVPHASQMHGLLDMGRMQMDSWFPDFSDELVSDGAAQGEGAAICMYIDGVRKVSVRGNRVIGMTRTFLEEHLRRRANALPGIQWIRGRAQGLIFQGNRVAGVRYAPSGPIPDGTEPALTDFAADLVVDATGRGTQLRRWLSEAGWPTPPVDRMTIDLGYATAQFHCDPGPELSDVMVAHSLVSPPEPGQHGHDAMAMQRVENDQWIAVIAGYGDRKPSTDPQEYIRRLAGSLAEPFRTLAKHELASDVTTYRMQHSLRRHFSRMDRLPGGLFAAGDAVASFNPVYGQGMTCAALHATSLSEHIRSGADLQEPAWSYFKRIEATVGAAWQLSTLGDLMQPHVTGPYPRGYRVSRRLGEWVTRASMTSQPVNEIYMDVINMRRHPNVFASPHTLLLVARALRQS